METLQQENKLKNPIFVGLVQGAALFLAVTIFVVLLSWQSYKNQKRDFTVRIENATRYAASLVDMDLHQKLVSPEQTNSALYNKVIEPLVKFHNSYPDIHYVYTIIEKGGKRYFILDTANSKHLHVKAKLEASQVMEWYDDSEVDSDWLEWVHKGKVFVDQKPYVDDFGIFLSGSAPLYDSQGKFAGIMGIDIDADTFFRYRDRVIANTSIICALALVLSTIVGFLKFRSEKYALELRNYERNLITTDPMTGAFNRRYYSELSSNELSRYKRYKDVYSIALIDIDHFKSINDTYGHDIGDRVLVNTVKRINTDIRSTDSLIRMGGEEFLVFMPNTSEAKALEISKRINSNLANDKMDFEDISFSITASIGVSSVHDTDMNNDEVYKRADICLYHAKESGRNRVIGTDQISDKINKEKEV